MKFLEKNICNKYYGIPLKETEYKNLTIKTKYLFGILYKKFDLVSYKIIYRLFGVNFMTKTFCCGKSIYKLLGFIKFNASIDKTTKFLIPILYEYLKDNCSKDNLFNERIDVIPLFNRSGETFLSMFHIKEFLKIHKIKNPIFIAIAPYLENILKMFLPDAEFILVPNVFWELYIGSAVTTTTTTTTHFEQYLPHTHFVALEKNAREGKNCFFYQELINSLNVSKTISTNLMYSQECIDSVNTRIKMLNLKSPFCFIAPDAQSNGTLPFEFWDKLSIILSKKGYDIFYNSIPYNRFNSSMKTQLLSLDETRYLAEQADIIIGVRSGLMDVISNNHSQIHCFYLPFHNRSKELPELSAEKVYNCFTLKQLPTTQSNNNIYEYVIEDNEDYKMLNKILDTISNSI